MTAAIWFLSLVVDQKHKDVAKRKDGRPVFSSGEVVKRKENFRKRLFNIVKSHHQVCGSYL